MWDSIADMGEEGTGRNSYRFHRRIITKRKISSGRIPKKILLKVLKLEIWLKKL
jgi:hypothetical protein